MYLSPYTTYNWLVTKQRIWKRDNGQCRICGRGGSDVHHIRYDKGFYNDNYLTLLCRPCHRCFSGDAPDHLPDNHSAKNKLARIAELARVVGKDRFSN
ncbi:HNH endonuclease [Novipirellula sp. SH528]|uniref:HNH endonuclease n=1 Tax=Novipirellula sp. SH528 TaxID=3454466 RepID=UPI003FA0C159